MTTMNALVYHGPNRIAWEEKPMPTVIEPTDAVVRITTTTLCGTDLHILKGDVAGVTDGRILGHEGIGIVEAIGEGVKDFRLGDKVLVAVISACGRCAPCKRGLRTHCEHGGWLLGNTSDGTQAEYVRVPFADNGLYHLPADIDEDAGVMLSCSLPTGMECGTLSGQVQPGDTVAIIGAGPVGLATLLTARLYSPGAIIAVDIDANRLQVARSMGATHVVNSRDGRAAERVMALTQGIGVDVAIEAVGIAATFDICQAIIAPGGRIANVGVHGAPVQFHLERLWAANLTLTTRLVDGGSTPMLLKMLRAGRLDARSLVSHHFALPDILQAYDIFGHAATHQALKVVLRAVHAT